MIWQGLANSLTVQPISAKDQKLLSPQLHDISFEDGDIVKFAKGPKDDTIVIIQGLEISILTLSMLGNDFKVDELSKAIKLPKLFDKSNI